MRGGDKIFIGGRLNIGANGLQLFRGLRAGSLKRRVNCSHQSFFCLFKYILSLPFGGCQDGAAVIHGAFLLLVRLVSLPDHMSWIVSALRESQSHHIFKWINRAPAPS